MRLERDYFEALYGADSDPWGFRTSDYERQKYERTLAALDGRRFRRGLDVGCSIGVLTRSLAEHCDSLLAVDVSDQAVASAREELADLEHVEVERRELPEELPAGPFDLVVCSEVLYYWDGELLTSALDDLSDELEPGGSLLAVHWRPETRTYPLQGDEVHELLRSRPELELAHTEPTERYLLDRFELRP